MVTTTRELFRLHGVPYEDGCTVTVRQGTHADTYVFLDSMGSVITTRNIKSHRFTDAYEVFYDFDKDISDSISKHNSRADIKSKLFIALVVISVILFLSTLFVTLIII